MIREPIKLIGKFQDGNLLSKINESSNWDILGSGSPATGLKILRDDLANLVDKLVRKYFKFKSYSWAIHKLDRGESIEPHVDSNTNNPKFHVYHFVLTTNPDVVFEIDGEQHHMKLGHIYEINYCYVHAVYNRGNSDRIHLMVELETY